MHRQGSIETFTLVLPQCPRVRKHAVTFRYSGKQFLITVAYIISSNHSPFVSGRRPVNRQRISRLLRLLTFANPAGSFREKGLTGISPIVPTCGGFPPRSLSISSSNPKNPLTFLLLGCFEHLLASNARMQVPSLLRIGIRLSFCIQSDRSLVGVI